MSALGNAVVLPQPHSITYAEVANAYVSRLAAKDNFLYVMVFSNQDLFVFFGPTAPANNNGSLRLEPNHAGFHVWSLRPGHQLWCRRAGNNNAQVSVCMWDPARMEELG